MEMGKLELSAMLSVGTFSTTIVEWRVKMKEKDRFVVASTMGEYDLCVTCGAMVADRTLHHNWHKEVELHGLYSNSWIAKKVDEIKPVFGQQPIGSGVDALLNPNCKCGHPQYAHIERIGGCTRCPSGVRCKCQAFEAV